MPCLIDNLLNGCRMLGYSLLEGKPHMTQEWRPEDGERPNAVEAAWRKCREASGLYRAVADEEVGVAKLPNIARRVEFDVLASSL